MRFLRRSSGQAATEFALVSLPLFLLFFGIIDFGVLYENRLSLEAGTRAAARFGAVQPGSFTNANPAATNSIEGRLQQTSGTGGIPNDDSHIVITYWIPGSGSMTPCAKYVAATNSVTYYGVYNKSTCLIVDNVIQVQVTSNYKFITPILAQAFSSGVPISTTATALIEQNAP